MITSELNVYCHVYAHLSRYIRPPVFSRISGETRGKSDGHTGTVEVNVVCLFTVAAVHLNK